MRYKSFSQLICAFTVFMASLFGHSYAVQAETLQEALISAYQTNPKLKAERARVKEADENYIQARAQGRLSSAFSATAEGQLVRTPGTTIFGGGEGHNLTDGYPRSLAVQVIQPIYQGGRVKALKSQARSGIFAAREGLRSAEQDLFLAVATAYVDVLRDEEAAKIRRNNVSVLARQEAAARARFDVGEGTLTDIAQSESRLAASNIGLAQADAQLATSRAAYERVVGHAPVDLRAAPKFVLPATLFEAQRIGLVNNPLLLASEHNVEAAKASIGVAKAAGKPSFAINGSLANLRSQLSAIGEADAASITAQLTIPFYSGGANKSRVRQAKSAVERLRFEVKDAENAVKQNVTQIWALLTSARLSLQASEQQVKAAEVAFEGVTLEQQVGTRDTLDVLNAEQEVLNAKLSVVNAQRTVDATTYQLLTLLGAFDADSIQLPVDSYDPERNFLDVKDDGLTKLVDKYVPQSVQNIGPELINVSKDTYKGVKSIGNSTDVITDAPPLEVQSEENIPPAPALISAPDW